MIWWRGITQWQSICLSCRRENTHPEFLSGIFSGQSSFNVCSEQCTREKLRGCIAWHSLWEGAGDILFLYLVSSPSAIWRKCIPQGAINRSGKTRHVSFRPHGGSINTELVNNSNMEALYRLLEYKLLRIKAPVVGYLRFWLSKAYTLEILLVPKCSCCNTTDQQTLSEKDQDWGTGCCT